ncbi:MAG: ketoacyl-ACP synthase III [Clostridia bacterium]|nr:ketoacyl-ACP synthase III [Clostridia bacterium]
MIGRIKGLGSYLPSKILTNQDLEKMVETSDEWIVERTGIRERHISDPNTETVSEMAIKASRAAIEDAGIDPLEIDFIVVASTTNNMVFPTTACLVQGAIGADNAQCFDMSSACPGFLTAFNVAQNFITAGQCKTALVIGSECLSNYLDWTDRGTCILFGDAAGAMILQADEETDDFHKCIMKADGKRYGCLKCESKMQRISEEDIKEKSRFYMEGREVFKFAATEVPKVILELCEKYSIDLNDIDKLVLHQANKRIIEAVSKRLSVPMDKFPMNIERTGNTSAASIPVLLTELKDAGELKRGEKLILSSFGAGLTWGAAYIEY